MPPFEKERDIIEEHLDVPSSNLVPTCALGSSGTLLMGLLGQRSRSPGSKLFPFNNSRIMPSGNVLASSAGGPGFNPQSQGPLHTKDVIKMVPGSSLV